MSAQGLKRCIEEKEAMSSRYAELANHCAKLEKECTLYERDIERLMDSCDDLARENEELRAQLRENVVSSFLILPCIVFSLNENRTVRRPH